MNVDRLRLIAHAIDTPARLSDLIGDPLPSGEPATTATVGEALTWAAGEIDRLRRYERGDLIPGKVVTANLAAAGRWIADAYEACAVHVETVKVDRYERGGGVVPKWIADELRAMSAAHSAELIGRGPHVDAANTERGDR